MVESQHRECDTTHPPLRPTRHSPMGHSKVACLTYRTRLPTWEVALRLFEQVDGGKSAPTECDTTHPPLHPTRHSPRGHSKVACLTYRTRLPTWEVSERQADGGQSAPPECDTTHPPASDCGTPLTGTRKCYASRGNKIAGV